MKLVLLLTYNRCGSSFLGSILNSNPEGTERERKRERGRERERERGGERELEGEREGEEVI